MATTFLRQETQIRPSDVYDDTQAAGSTLESGAAHIEDDLNALRSQIKRIFLADDAGDWFQDVDTITSIGASKKYGLKQLATQVDDLEEHRFLFRAAIHTDVAVPATQNWVVLSVAGGETPTQTAALGATTKGAVVAQATTFGAHNLDEVAGATPLSPKNLCIVHDGSTGAVLKSNNREISALLQSEIATDGHTFDDSTQRVQLSFVRPNASNDDLEACPVADIENQTVHYAYVRRLDFDSIPEQGFLTGTFTDSSAAATEVTLDNAVDNQVGNVTQTAKNILWEIDDTFRFAFMDSAGAVDILAVKPASGGDEVEMNVALLDINNSSPVDVAQGMSVDTTDQAINIGVNAAGQIDSGGAMSIQSGGGGDLRLLAANELLLDDVNQSGSTWAQTTGIKLSETTAEWDDFEVNFGEVSLLNALSQAANSGNAGTIRRAKVLSNITAGTNVTGAGGSPNIDTQLQDHSGLTFVAETDTYVNGIILVPATDTSEDVYPGDTPANGDLKFTFNLKASPNNPDVITFVTYAGRSN